MRRLRADGCTEAQGYLLSRPVPAMDVAGLITKLSEKGTEWSSQEGAA
jgi:EAL domain-containing protein (putative c-di-GMP-specific phosphodiesterase class I)